MSLERIRERLANGFKPFVIELSSGKRIRVIHPDLIMVGKGTVAVMGEADSITTADALHIVSIEDFRGAKRRKQTH
jgi:hypothetical protein